MLVCNCTLSGTKACLTCPNYLTHVYNFYSVEDNKITLFQKYRIIEKFENGNLTERITEEI